MGVVCSLRYRGYWCGVGRRRRTLGSEETKEVRPLRLLLSPLLELLKRERMALVAVWVCEMIHASGGSAVLASAERDGLAVMAGEHGVVRCRLGSVVVWWRRCWWWSL